MASFWNFSRGRHTQPSPLPIFSSPSFPGKMCFLADHPRSSCFSHSLVGFRKGFVTLKKSFPAAGPPGGPSVCAFWTEHLGFSTPTPSTNYRMGKTPEKLHLRAKYSLENISKAFSNFLEIDKCFQDSDFVTGWCLAPACLSFPLSRCANPASLPPGSQPAFGRLFFPPWGVWGALSSLLAVVLGNLGTCRRWRSWREV